MPCLPAAAPSQIQTKSDKPISRGLPLDRQAIPANKWVKKRKSFRMHTYEKMRYKLFRMRN